MIRVKAPFTSLILIAFLTTGCTTTSFLGLTRASYFEQLEQKQSEQFAEIHKENRDQEEMLTSGLEDLKNRDDLRIIQIQQDLKTVQIQLEEIQILSMKLDELSVRMEKMDLDTEELQILADQFKTRMETIYKDTLNVLVTALEQYIENTEQL